VTSAVITRPRHPLQGRSLPVLGRLRRHGRVELLLVLPDGSKSLVPAAWTDQADTEDVEEAAATLGSLTDLLHACAVLAALVPAGARQDEQAARQSPSKEDNRAACAAQSDAGPGAGATPGPRRAGPRTAAGRGDRAADRPDRQGGRPADGRANGGRR
jgi:hypothetical protein